MLSTPTCLAKSTCSFVCCIAPSVAETTRIAQTSKEKIQEFKDLFDQIGLSFDWDLTYATDDQRCQTLSQKSFLDLYKKGVICKQHRPCTSRRSTKAQIHAGGRGEAGGVKIVKSAADAMLQAEKMLGINVHNQNLF